MNGTHAMMTAADLHETLWDLVADQANVERTYLKQTSRLSDDLGADSLTLAELTLAIEDRLGATLPDDLLEQPHLTLGQVEEALVKLCCQRQAP